MAAATSSGQIFQFDPAPAAIPANSVSSNLSLDARRRRIVFRSWHRGMREMDLILGPFADAEIARLCKSELDDYERLLEAQDRDVFSWLTFEAETPSSYDTPVLRKIRAAAGPCAI